MDEMRILGIAAKWLFMLCLPILLLTASLGWTANSLWLYKYGFYRYSINQTPELAEFDLDRVATELISYFNSDEDYISLTVVKDGEPFVLFNQQEVMHLKDVKGLIWLDYRVLLGTLVYVLAYAGVCLLWQKRRYWRRLAWGVVGGGGITLALMLALGLGILFGFSQLFWQFHVISFSNEFWLLDPTKDYLKMLFPDGFFYDAALFCAGITAGLAIILGGVGGGYLLFSRKATLWYNSRQSTLTKL
jgi:integral membrane protein (TIGR01906 family)